MRFIVILLLLGNLTNGTSQIIITDAKNKAIPYVQVSSKNSYFIAQTDLDGSLILPSKGLLDTDTLIFNHISYESTYHTKKDLLPGDTIRMIPRSYHLKEVKITSKTQKNSYQKINACFRSFQANDDSIAYYTDGKAEYMSKINKKKFQILLKEYRAFENSRLEEQAPHRNVGITFIVARTPIPPFDYLPFQYSQRHHLTYKYRDEGGVEIFNRDSVLIGKIEKDSRYIKYNINDIYSIRNRKALQTEINMMKQEVLMVFRNNGSPNEELKENFDDLLYVKIVREFKVKHEKDKDYTEILNIDEIFFEDVSYTTSLGSEEYSSYQGMPKRSNYTSEFWKNCNCETYYLPNDQIIQGLHKR